MNISTSQESGFSVDDESCEECGEGLCGIENLGNTCYFNSVLQCLIHTPTIREKVLLNDNDEELSQKKAKDAAYLAYQFRRVIKGVWAVTTKPNMYLEPLGIIRAFKQIAGDFLVNEQQDAHEFFAMLVDALNEGEKNEKPKSAVASPAGRYYDVTERANKLWNCYINDEDSFITENFAGQLHSKLTFECGHVSHSFEPFRDLALPVTKGENINIYHCLDDFIEIEDLETALTCSECNKSVSASKELKIQRLPPYLVIVLKRFANSDRLEKINTMVSFPMKGIESKCGTKLHLANFLSEASQYAPPRYKLYGVVHHIGNPGAGHYFADCLIKNKWWRFDDDEVLEIEPIDVHVNSAYILFFRSTVNV